MSTIPNKLGRYDIIREVGRGAMGVVYKAHDPVIEREVALKAINLSFEVNEEEKSLYLSRFFREAKAAGKLNHPGIVTIFDVGEDKETGVPFIVMEFLEGTTLQELTRSGNLLPVRDINNIISQLAEALHYAHQEGVVHRDVKPANILIVPEMKAKITDFGIARLPQSDLTQSGQFVGTPNYMSPEQLAGKSQLDGRADLFSLGVIFYMMLTGERPFSGESFNTVSYKIAHVDPEPPRALNPSIPEVYNAILKRLLAKDPDQRYASGKDLAADIKSLEPTLSGVESEPTAALPPPGGASPRESSVGGEKKQIKSATHSAPQGNNRNLLIISGLLILLGVIGAGAYFYRPQKQAVPVAQPAVVAPSSVPTTTITQKPPNSDQLMKDIANKTSIAKGLMESARRARRSKKGEQYEKAKEAWQNVLEIDSGNEEAIKALSEIEQIQNPELKAKIKQESAVTPVSAPPAPTQSTKPKQPPKPAVDPKSQQPTTVTPVPTVAVTFSMQHNFASGTILIHAGNQLVEQSGFEGQEKKKLLVIKTYEGTWEKTLQIPISESNLKIQVTSPEGEFSKQVSAKFQEGMSYRIQIRYLKATKELEVKVL